MVQYLFLVFSNNKTQKTTLSINGYPEEMILGFGLCLSWHLKWVFYIGTLLETINIVLKTHFRFEFRSRSPEYSARVHGGCTELDYCCNHEHKGWWGEECTFSLESIYAVQSIILGPDQSKGDRSRCSRHAHFIYSTNKLQIKVSIHVWLDGLQQP